MIEKQKKSKKQSDFRRGFLKEAENLSLSVRAEMGISKYAPLDAFKLASHKEITIYTFDEILCNDDFIHERNILKNDPEVSALYTINRWDEKIIIHKNSDSPARQQSNIMHEISHILLNHTVPLDMLKIASKFRLCYDNKTQEKEARYLGGCLQLTKPSLLWCLKINMSPEEIAEKYLASLEMVDYRIKITGAEKIRYFTSKKTNS